MGSVVTQGQLWRKAAHDWARLLKAAVLHAVAPYQASTRGVGLLNCFRYLTAVPAAE